MVRHLWTALRYAELNPVRAGIVAEASAWPWSRAAGHCGIADPEPRLDLSAWCDQWRENSWRKFLKQGESESELRTVRRCTHSGRPLGSAELAEALEQPTGHRLIPGKGGRPPNARSREIQQARTLPA